MNVHNALRRPALVLVAVLGLAGCIAATATPSLADRGVSLTIGRFEIDQKLTKGREYTLAGFGVKNPGTETTTYRLGTMEVRGEELAPAEWFTFAEREVSLQGGAERAIPVKLVVPGSAKPGRYQAYLKAEIAPGDGAGTSVGAAAAAPVVFEVKASSLVEEWRTEASDAVDATAPWGYIGAGLAALAGLAYFLRRKLAISIAVRP
jgi:hypothetical protein